ncbi:hypothetical protein GCM10009827_084010 [Dactylosporangium maewongense]|uniref:Uncharacterized protein n=1 Tax=Dactylosporangium maewongense TaxID=634393 RepID=A0ABN2C1N2_9ACTN
MTLALSQEQVDLDFAEICRRERLGLLRYAKSLLGDWHDAEDAVQEAFLRLLETVSRRGVPQNLAAVLTVMTRHKAMNIRHSRFCGPIACDVLDEFVEDCGFLPEDTHDVYCMADESTVAAVDAVLATLPPRRRLAIEMWCLRGLTIAEVAAHLQVSRGTASDLIYPTLIAIRQGTSTAERESVAAHQAEMRSLLARPELADSLTPMFRQALVLRYVEGLAPRAIAEQLSITADSVKSRLRHGRTELRGLSAGVPPTRDGAVARAVREGRLNHLPARTVQVAQLRYIDCLEQALIAEQLGFSVYTVQRECKTINAAFLALSHAGGSS